MKQVLALAVLVGMVGAAAAAQEHQHGSGGTASGLGTVDFANSCASAERSEFNHAVALLHSFEYDEARAGFAALAKKDPDCPMAQWGVAMTYVHGLWGEIDVTKGRTAATAAQKLASEDRRTTAREKAYIEAIAALYEGDQVKLNERLKKLADKMAALHAAYSEDTEAAIFYALALDEAALPTDKTYANQRKCGEILEPLFRKLPSHPGIAHYLIHCYDNSALAAQGLEAARTYAKIAPDSAHAQHMPSHIFVLLGLWQETVESNITSVEAAEKDAAASECQRHGNQTHAMHFLQYGYLQQGKLKQAREVAVRSRNLPPVGADCYSTPDYVAASFALDAHDWDLARQLEPSKKWHDPLTWAAVGIGSARAGDLKRAREAEAHLQTVRDEMAKMSPYGARNAIEIYRLEVAVWIAQSEGQHAEAAESMRAAADLGDEHGWPAWVAPLPREMLGDLLLEQKQPEAALEAYRRVLETEPRLFNPLYGAARAAEAVGDRQSANAYYRKVTEIASKGDRPEVEIVLKKVETIGRF